MLCINNCGCLFAPGGQWAESGEQGQQEVQNKALKGEAGSWLLGIGRLCFSKQVGQMPVWSHLWGWVMQMDVVLFFCGFLPCLLAMASFVGHAIDPKFKPI